MPSIAAQPFGSLTIGNVETSLMMKSTNSGLFAIYHYKQTTFRATYSLWVPGLTKQLVSVMGRVRLCNDSKAISASQCPPCGPRTSLALCILALHLPVSVGESLDHPIPGATKNSVPQLRPKVHAPLQARLDIQVRQDHKADHRRLSNRIGTNLIRPLAFLSP